MMIIVNKYSVTARMLVTAQKYHWFRLRVLDLYELLQQKDSRLQSRCQVRANAICRQSELVAPMKWRELAAALRF